MLGVRRGVHAAGKGVQKKGLGMLVLTRRKEEVIKIGDDIEVVVVEIDGNRVKIGVKAPPDVVILRQELVKAGRPPQAGDCKVK